MNDSKANNTESRTIRVPALARVEGEGRLHLEMAGGQVKEVRLDIYEPPRFFEAFLRGRDFREVPDITARICGICPVAYQMGCCHALEKAMGVFDQIDPAIRRLRNLLYCGEWIESHILHMFMLHLPDFMGQESIISMAGEHATLIRRALRIKKLGNSIVAALGGRSVHPVGVCVGGFYKPLSETAAAELLGETRVCLADMCELALLLASTIQFPVLERDYEFLCLCPADEYPMNLGRIRSSKGLNVDQAEFAEAIEERHLAHSTALYAGIKGRSDYVVGPLARLNLNHEKLQPPAGEVLKQILPIVKAPLPWRNSYLGLLARAVEVVHAMALSQDILQSYALPPRSRIPIAPRAGTGAHGTEAPRGLCWHRYRTEADGTIASAQIIPPTSQNQWAIERDLAQLAPSLGSLPDEQAALRCEHLIRNYDPCISCSVHFLKFRRTESIV